MGRRTFMARGAVTLPPDVGPFPKPIWKYCVLFQNPHENPRFGPKTQLSIWVQPPQRKIPGPHNWYWGNRIVSSPPQILSWFLVKATSSLSCNHPRLSPLWYNSDWFTLSRLTERENRLPQAHDCIFHRISLYSYRHSLLISKSHHQNLPQMTECPTTDSWEGSIQGLIISDTFSVHGSRPMSCPFFKIWLLPSPPSGCHCSTISSFTEDHFCVTKPILQCATENAPNLLLAQLFTICVVLICTERGKSTNKFLDSAESTFLWSIITAFPRQSRNRYPWSTESPRYTNKP